MQLMIKDLVRQRFRDACIMVTHDRDEAYRLCDGLIILDEGRIAENGETKALFAAPCTYAGARITGCKNISRVEHLGGGVVLATDFGIRLFLGNDDIGDVEAIGIRAHDFKEYKECTGAMPGDEDHAVRTPDDRSVAVLMPGEKGFVPAITEIGPAKENIIEIERFEVIPSPFEDTVIVKPAGSPAQLWWKRKTRGLPVPDRVYIEPSEIMRLKKQHRQGEANGTDSSR